MNLKEYQEACKKTAKEFATPETEIATWGLGIAGEAGDVASCIKKVFAQKNEAIKEGLKENLGDIMWYIAMICNFFDWELEGVLNENIEKLRKRYPKGFTFKDAQRDGTMIKWSGFDKDEKYIKSKDKKEK
jgi:NTP pyrophosphatase (non-canonical NTP hydrolase)